jgi:hypothetical protein
MEMIMSDSDTGFDTLLAARFEREHAVVPADPFVAATMRRVRSMQRRSAGLRISLRIAALLGVVVASPWLTAGAARLNAALESSFTWTAELPGAWALAALALVLVAMLRSGARSR